MRASLGVKPSLKTHTVTQSHGVSENWKKIGVSISVAWSDADAEKLKSDFLSDIMTSSHRITNQPIPI